MSFPSRTPVPPLPPTRSNEQASSSPSPLPILSTSSQADSQVVHDVLSPSQPTTILPSAPNPAPYVPPVYSPSAFHPGSSSSLPPPCPPYHAAPSPAYTWHHPNQQFSAYGQAPNSLPGQHAHAPYTSHPSPTRAPTPSSMEGIVPALVQHTHMLSAAQSELNLHHSLPTWSGERFTFPSFRNQFTSMLPPHIRLLVSPSSASLLPHQIDPIISNRLFTIIKKCIPTEKFLEYSYTIGSDHHCGHRLFLIMVSANSSISGADMLRLTSDLLNINIDPDENIFEAASRVRDICQQFIDLQRTLPPSEYSDLWHRSVLAHSLSSVPALSHIISKFKSGEKNIMAE